MRPEAGEETQVLCGKAACRYSLCAACSCRRRAISEFCNRPESDKIAGFVAGERCDIDEEFFADGLRKLAFMSASNGIYRFSCRCGRHYTISRVIGKERQAAHDPALTLHVVRKIRERRAQGGDIVHQDVLAPLVDRAVEISARHQALHGPGTGVSGPVRLHDTEMDAPVGL